MKKPTNRDKIIQLATTIIRDVVQFQEDGEPVSQFEEMCVSFARDVLEYVNGEEDIIARTLAAPGIFGSMTTEQRQQVVSSDVGETSGSDDEEGEKVRMLSKSELKRIVEAECQKMLSVSTRTAFKWLDEGKLHGTLAASVLEGWRLLLKTAKD